MKPINPILGTAYESFWLRASVERLWKKYSFHPIQAHHGHLETYLNGGRVGVRPLMAVIISMGRRLKKELLLGSR